MGSRRGKRAKPKKPAASSPDSTTSHRPSARWPLALALIIGAAAVIVALARRPHGASGPQPSQDAVVASGATEAWPIDDTAPTTFQQLKEESFVVVKELMQRRPQDAAAVEKAAQLAGLFGEKELACRYWAQCVQLAPHFMRARYFLAWFALQDGRYDDMANHSRQALTQVAASSQDATVFRDLLGCALVELGNTEEARQILDANVQRKVATCDTFTLLGKACLLARDYEDASKYYLEAIKIDPAWSKALYGLATAKRRLGKLEQAKELFDQFRKNQATESVSSDAAQFAAAQRDVAMVYHNIAAMYSQAGDVSRAEILEQRSRQLQTSSGAHQPAEPISQQPRRISGK